MDGYRILLIARRRLLTVAYWSAWVSIGCTTYRKTSNGEPDPVSFTTLCAALPDGKVNPTLP
jgi:hypothetical protein